MLLSNEFHHFRRKSASDPEKSLVPHSRHFGFSVKSRDSAVTGYLLSLYKRTAGREED
jgi:hypothetical protein